MVGARGKSGREVGRKGRKGRKRGKFDGSTELRQEGRQRGWEIRKGSRSETKGW